MSTIQFEPQQGVSGGGGGGDVDKEYVDLRDGFVLQEAKDYADNGLENKVDKIAGKGLSAEDYTANEKTTVGRLNNGFVTGVANTSVGDTVSLEVSKFNPSDGTASNSPIELPKASATTAGVVESATYNAIQSNATNIDAILHGSVSISGIAANPAQADLTTAWQAATGLTTVINGAKINDPDNQKVWTYYTNTATWYAATNTAQVVINTATDSAKGIVQGDGTTAGKVHMEMDGTMSVNGWGSLVNSVVTNTGNIANKADASSLGAVATSNDYDDLDNKPTIPTVNNGTLTIQKNGVDIATFSANSASDATANITMPNVTITSTDPGAGGTLATGDFIIVYEA